VSWWECLLSGAMYSYNQSLADHFTIFS
jgi:hypothetical protein